MKILFALDDGETMTDFRIAEAVVNLCEEGWGLDAKIIAKMILLEKESEDTE